MKLAPYWSKATIEEADQAGQAVSASCWRWSEVSEQDAHRSALAAAKQIALRLIRGEPLDRYQYGSRPLREELIQSVTDQRGEISLAVTRNRYGSLVLNTAEVMFIDVDFPPIGLGAHLRHFFSKLLGGKGRRPEVQQEAEFRQTLANFVAGHADWGLRIYRTFAGLRVLVTHDLFDPEADQIRRLLESLGADPLYVRLCRNQQCFRARLTPKPWRCGQPVPPGQWPRDDDDQLRFQSWQAEYERHQAHYATCRYLESLGASAIHPAVRPVIDLHDHFTRCQEPLPLA